MPSFEETIHDLGIFKKSGKERSSHPAKGTDQNVQQQALRHQSPITKLHQQPPRATTSLYNLCYTPSNLSLSLLPTSQQPQPVEPVPVPSTASTTLCPPFFARSRLSWPPSALLHPFFLSLRHVQGKNRDVGFSLPQCLGLQPREGYRDRRSELE